MSYMEQKMQEQIEGSLYNEEQKYLEDTTQISERKRVTLEFFEQLNEPERTQAIENLENNYECENLHHAITSGFCWGETPQGHYYWENIASKIHTNTYHTKPLDIEGLAKEMYPTCFLDRKVVVEVYNKLKQLGKIKE